MSLFNLIKNRNRVKSLNKSRKLAPKIGKKKLKCDVGYKGQTDEQKHFWPILELRWFAHFEHSVNKSNNYEEKKNILSTINRFGIFIV